MSVSEETSQPTVSPPSATGAAGPVLEGNVGGFYLLSLLANGEPRGLPGATAESVSFQQGDFGFPLDDIVVHARNADGSPATLEIQSKRGMTFTASDSEFRDVVGRMWLAFQKPEFAATRYELAVAIGKTTTRIEADCQEALFWARELLDGATFAAHIDRTGFSSAGMRSFVDVFKKNLRHAGAPDDEATVWKLLQRFQILVFDFQSHGADHAHQARERSRTVLTPGQSGRSSDLWAVLSNRAMHTATAAGSKNWAYLVDWLTTQHGFDLAVPADLRAVHRRLKDDAASALADIKHTVGGVRLSRTQSVTDGLSGLETNKALGIIGAAGTGKSAVLKHIAQLKEAEGTVLFLSHGRIVPGGGLAWAHVIGCQLPLPDLLHELACGGSATLFIDNVDQIDDRDRLATVNDLLRAATGIANWRIAFTAADTRAEWLGRFPALQASSVATLTVGEIDDQEAAQLNAANPALFAVLDAQHPARGLARNLFLLSRLLDLCGTNGTLASIAKEADLAAVWWRYGGGRSEDNRVARLRALRKMAGQIVRQPAISATRMDDLDPPTVEELLRLDSIREHQPNFSVAFRHDVLRDWTIGFLLHDDPALLDTLDASKPLPEALSRALEFTAKIALDADETASKWLGLSARFSGATVHGSWRRAILLAVPRSEHALALFEKLKSLLLADEGRLLAELLKLMQSVETQPLKALLQKAQPGIAIPARAEGLMISKGNGWLWLVIWLAGSADDLPHALIPDAARLFHTWLVTTQAQPSRVHVQVMRVLFNWLIRIDASLNQTVVRSFDEIKDPDFTFPRMREVRDDIRLTFFSCCHLAPELSEQYLKSLDPDAIRHTEADKIICHPGSLTRTAPAAFTDFALTSLIEQEDEDNPYSRSSRYQPFSVHELNFSPASPGQGPFFELLQHSPYDGLRLVRAIVEHATQWWRAKHDDEGQAFPTITVRFPGGDRTFAGGARVYGWSRSESPSPMVTSGLMALEAWGHQQIESGRPFQDLFADVVSDDGSSIAFLAVAVDLALSHWAAAHKTAWPLLASPELLRYDDWRYTHDISGANRLQLRLKEERPHWKVRRADLDARPSRQNRLWECIGEFAISGPKDEAKALQLALESAHRRISSSNSDDGDPVDGLKACAKRAWRMSDPANWLPVTVELQDGSRAQRLQFEQDPVETAHREARAQAARDNITNTNVRLSIQGALFDASKSTPEIVGKAVSWAKAKQAAPAQAKEGEDRDEEFDRNWDKRAVVMAAALAARDYSAADRSAVREWALSMLNTAAAVESTEYYRNPQVEYNSQAIATLGLVELYEREQSADLQAILLAMCKSRDPAVRNAIFSQFRALHAVVPEFVRAVIRIAMTSGAHVHSYDDDANAQHKATLAAAIAARAETERNWLTSGGPEPDWPELAGWITRPRRGIRIGRCRVEEDEEDTEPPEVMADEHALGQLTQHLVVLTVGGAPSWLADLAERLMHWTDAANGPHDPKARDRDHRPTVWNDSFFDFLGVLSVALPHEQVLEKFVAPLAGFNDEAFYDCAADFLRGYDRATYAPDTLNPDNPLAVRNAIAERMKDSLSFRSLMREKSFSSEFHLADLISAFFYHRGSLQLSNQPSFPTGWKGIGGTFGCLTDIVTAAPTSGYLATAYLNVLGQAPRPEFLPHVVKAMSAWSAAYGVDANFWVERDIGPRCCTWLEQALAADAQAFSDASIQAVLFGGLDVMVKAGVGQARQVEDAMRQVTASG